MYDFVLSLVAAILASVVHDVPRDQLAVDMSAAIEWPASPSDFPRWRAGLDIEDDADYIIIYTDGRIETGP